MAVDIFAERQRLMQLGASNRVFVLEGVVPLCESCARHRPNKEIHVPLLRGLLPLTVAYHEMGHLMAEDTRGIFDEWTWPTHVLYEMLFAREMLAWDWARDNMSASLRAHAISQRTMQLFLHSYLWRGAKAAGIRRIWTLNAQHLQG